MATLITEVELSDLKNLKASDIKRLQCCEIYEDGEYVFTAIIPGTDFIRVSAENSGLLSNSVAGEIPEQVIRQATTVKPSLEPLKTEIIETVTHPVATEIVEGVTTFTEEPELYISDKPYKSKRKKKKHLNRRIKNE